MLSTMPVTFFTIAVILNLNNWIFYYFKIGEMASHIDDRAKIHANLADLKRNSKILNLITALSIIVVSVFLTYVTVLSLKNSDDDDFI